MFTLKLVDFWRDICTNSQKMLSITLHFTWKTPNIYSAQGLPLKSEPGLIVWTWPFKILAAEYIIVFLYCPSSTVKTFWIHCWIYPKLVPNSWMNKRRWKMKILLYKKKLWVLCYSLELENLKFCLEVKDDKENKYRVHKLVPKKALVR